MQEASSPQYEGASMPSSGSSYMENSAIPPWAEFILAQMDKRFDSQDAKLEKLVTRDAFREEQSRVNDLIRDLQKDASKNAADIQSEATARANSELARTARERDESQRQQATERQTRWQWFLIPAVPIVGYLIPWIMGGGLTQP